MKNPKFSIIMPVYNSEKYLQKMVDSVLAQTYTNFELILVDDGSTDGSPDICDEYAEKDSRVIVIHKSNGGVSAARNQGIDIATGDYQIVWDSDDYVAPDTLLEVVKAIEQESPDVVKWNFVVESGKNSKTVKVVHPYNKLLEKQYIIEEIIPYMIGVKQDETKKIEGHWTFAINRRIIEEFHIRYDVRQKKEEDHLYIVKVMSHAESILLLSGCFYHYIKHENSLVSQFSPIFQNYCITLNTYEELFETYFDFKAQSVIRRYIGLTCDSLFFVRLHKKQCNYKGEIQKILSSKECKEWFELLIPYDHYTKVLKQCVQKENYTRAFFDINLQYYRIRFHHLVNKLHK